MSFYEKLENVNVYIEMCKDYSPVEIVEKVHKYLEVNSTILELGTGPGKDLDLLKEDYNITGSDKYIEFINVYKENNPESEILLLDAVTLETENKYDCIYSNKVLMHLTKEDLDKSIKNQHRTLNKGGIVFHTFWKGDTAEHKYDMLTQYYLEEELISKFSKLFDLIHVEAYKEFEEDDSILIVMKKK